MFVYLFCEKILGKSSGNFEIFGGKLLDDEDVSWENVRRFYLHDRLQSQKELSQTLDREVLMFPKV